MKGWPEVGDDSVKPNDPDCKVTMADLDEGLPQKMLDKDAPVITGTNRKRMAWVALISIVIATLLYTGIIAFMTDAPADKRIDKLVDIYFYFTGFLSSVILGYFGFTTLPFVGRSRNG